MFCSNCGRTIRMEDEACQHCGASLGENRFYGNTYTSCQVRIPAEALNEAPAGGMISYTRTSYMSYDNQPEDDVYSNTTYRPLLSEEEDLTIAEEEEAAAEAAAIAAEEAAEAAAQAKNQQAEEEFPGEMDEPEASEEPAPEEEAPAPAAEDIPGAPAEEEEDDFVESTSPLPPLKKAAISPRVLSYMEELDRLQERKASGGGLRMPSFLKKKAAPAPQEEELPEAEDILSAEDGYDEAEYAEGEYESAPEYEESYDEEAPADEYAEGYAQEEALPAEEPDYDADMEAYAEAEEAEAGEYVAEDDEYEYYEDDELLDEESAAKPGFDFSRLKLNIDIKALLRSRALQIGVAAVLIVAVISVGIVWLNFVTANRSKIVDVTYSVYTGGIELLTSRAGEEYRSQMKDVYLTNTSYANQAFSEDIASLNALMPADPMANDELFVTALTIIQDSIAEAIKADADAELNGTAAQEADASALRWQAVSDALDRLSKAVTPGELSVIASDLQRVVSPTPSPTPVPTEKIYPTLTNGQMDNPDVKLMQNRLINLGFLDSERPDGDFGNGTEAAVKAFQRAAGMTADGIATHEVQKAMYAEDAPRTGTALVAPTNAPDTGAAPQNPAVE